MKKFLSTVIIVLYGLRAMAQLGELTVDAERDYVHGQDIAVSGSFTPNHPSEPSIVQHTWELFLCDADGEPEGEPVMSETLPGMPENYAFTNTGSLEADRLYQVTLTVTNEQNEKQSATPNFPLISVSKLIITAPWYECCSTAVTASATYTLATGTTSWQWKLYKSTGPGGVITTLIDNQSGTGSPSTWNIPASSTQQLNCTWGFIQLTVTNQYNGTLTVGHHILMDNSVMPKVSNAYGPSPLAYPKVVFCGTSGGYLCIDLNQGDVVNYFIGNNTMTSGGNCLYVPQNAGGTYQVNMTNHCNVTGNVYVNVYPYDNDPSYTVSGATAINAFTYRFTATPANTAALPAFATHSWEVGEVTQTGNVYQYVLGTVAKWTTNSTPQAFTFCDYNCGSCSTPPPYYNTAMTYPTGSCSNPGVFGYGKYYRVVHKVYCPTCATTGQSNVKNANGFVCQNCDERKNPDEPDMTEAFIMLDGKVTATEKSVASGIQMAKGFFPLSVYPNPGTGLFHLHTDIKGKGTIEVCNVLGTPVQSLQIDEVTDEYTLNLSGYAPGIYILKMHAGADVYSKKIVLQ